MINLLNYFAVGIVQNRAFREANHKSLDNLFEINLQAHVNFQQVADTYNFQLITFNLSSVYRNRRLVSSELMPYE